VVKTSLGGMRIIIGGEVDCLICGEKEAKEMGSNAMTERFVELKTHFMLSGAKDEINFER
jgi:hypothetical protein